MPRDRYQKGRVVETSGRTKVWRGHYYVYSKTPEGEEVRKHRNVSLGPKSELKKWEAEKKLQEIIASDVGAGSVKPAENVSLAWFWEKRFLPLQVRWRESTRIVIEAIFKRHVLEQFGELPLKSIKRFELQTHLNSLAKRYSKSLVKKVRTWIKAALEEAVEQEYLAKNPARRLSLPPTRGTCRRFLSLAEYRRMIDILDGRDQLIFRLFVLGAFRPGELFALRWKCFEDETLKVEASVFRGKLGLTKTKSSAGVVTLPRSLAAELEQWRQYMGCPDPEDLIFPSTVNRPINSQNYLQRFLQPTAAKAGIEGLTFQCLRRTFATHFHGLGTIKDQQSQMRHSTAQITLDVYTQTVSESLRTAIEVFDHKLRIATGKGMSTKPTRDPQKRRVGSEPQSDTADNEPQEGFEPK